jgi:hypothetical protein
MGQQHLLVGVPSQSPGAARPSHFDPVDEHKAHCVSGNSLTAGNDYPVGEAFPHPQQEGAFFHLVYLPTPRRKMAYRVEFAAAEERAYLAAISRRTLDRALAEQRPLTEPELLMLGELDPTEVSRFAGRYFLRADDGPLAISGPLRIGGRPSRFGMIAARLAIDGTRDAMPGLSEAIAKDRFLPPNQHAPCRLHWMAALAIAARDPWKDCDDWLAKCIRRTERLIDGEEQSAEVGATAAAVLLSRHKQAPQEHGLLPAGHELLNQLGLPGWRFADEAAREKMQKWRAEMKNVKKTP